MLYRKDTLLYHGRVVCSLNSECSLSCLSGFLHFTKASVEQLFFLNIPPPPRKYEGFREQAIRLIFMLFSLVVQWSFEVVYVLLLARKVSDRKQFLEQELKELVADFLVLSFVLHGHRYICSSSYQHL